MALSKTAADTAASDSSEFTKRKCASPISSCSTGNNSFTPRDTRLVASVERRPMNLELNRIPKAPGREGAKDATTHDFLSLYKNAAVIGNIETGGLSPSITQDLLQPLENCAQPVGGNLVTSGCLTFDDQINHYRTTNQACFGGVQGASYGHSNNIRDVPTKSMWIDGLDRGLTGVNEDNHAHWSTSQLKFGTQELNYMAKSGSTHSQLETGQQHTSSPKRQWQHIGSDFCNVGKEPHIVTSRVTKDEEYSDCDIEIEKKDFSFQKGDVLQNMDGKSSDCKLSTPRSKHSATEQRRRCKINDRFQMLRQLVPNTDQKRDKASFLLEVIEYIQVLQEKLRKYESTEHGRQQERLKTIAWDVPQRNSGFQDFTPIVSTVPSDWKKATNNQPGRPKSTTLGEYGSVGEITLPVDRAIEDSRSDPSNPENVAISSATPVSLCGQVPVHILYERNANLPNVCVLPSVTESQLSCHRGPDDEKVTNKVETVLPVSHKNSQAPAQLMWRMNEEQRRDLETKKYGFSQQDANCETGVKDGANGKGNSCQESEPSVARSSFELLQSKDVYFSRHNSGINPIVIHRPKTPERSVTFPSLQEVPVIQGDNANVSNLYSQKLLNMLTDEFKSSGFDLSKTSISVQINLGKAATQSTEAHQQSAGQGKRRAPQSLEDVNKRTKILSES